MKIQICTKTILALSLSRFWPDGLEVWWYADSQSQRKNIHPWGWRKITAKKIGDEISFVENLCLTVIDERTENFVQWAAKLSFERQENLRKKIKKNVERGAK